ncbi:hypothetical protein SLS62_003663 [Diatrype stigma]|uniref:DUF155 domain-containing protein n=1 Tax=Diatrype stigma TaxID=117547 RepID=A0AAN9YUG5_9PEZI
MRASLQRIIAAPIARGLHTRAPAPRPQRCFLQTSPASAPRKRNLFTSSHLLSNGEKDAGSVTSAENATSRPETPSPTQQSQSQQQQQEATATTPTPASKRKTARAVAASKSLRLGSMSKQPPRLAKPALPASEIEYWRTISAVCVAREFDMEAVQEILRYHGFELDPDGTNFDPMAVVHARGVNNGDIFVFPYGTVVSWSMPADALETLATKQLVRAAETPHIDRMEVEDLEYITDETRDTSYMKGNVVVLGTKKQESENDRRDTTFAKVAFSSSLARSPKLAVLETSLMDYFQGSKTMLDWLERGLQDKLSSKLVLKKTGELLSLRAQLNHYSDITDHLPDMFWDSESKLEDYYNQVGAEMDVRSRISILNRKIDYAHETVSVLREMTTERHSTRLEVIIILLIAVEVFFELRRVYKEEWGGWARGEKVTETGAEN